MIVSKIKWQVYQVLRRSFPLFANWYGLKFFNVSCLNWVSCPACRYIIWTILFYIAKWPTICFHNISNLASGFCIEVCSYFSTFLSFHWYTHSVVMGLSVFDCSHCLIRSGLVFVSYLLLVADMVVCSIPPQIYCSMTDHHPKVTVITSTHETTAQYIMF